MELIEHVRVTLIVPVTKCVHVIEIVDVTRKQAVSVKMYVMIPVIV